MSNKIIPQSLDTLSNGRTGSDGFITWFDVRDPTEFDTQFPVSKRWFNTLLNKEWILIGFSNRTTPTNPSGQTSANWVLISNIIGAVSSVTGMHGVTASPTTGDVIVSGVNATTTTVGVSSFNATNFSVSGTGEVTSNAITVALSGGLTGSSSVNLGETLTIVGDGATSVSSVVKQVFTTSGTYTPTSGMLYCVVEVVGGGGGGGGTQATGASTAACGAGGGSGNYTTAVFSAATIGPSQTVTIATAAAGGIGGNQGATGGTCSFGSLLTALGGTGGFFGTSSASGTTIGGTGGTGGTGAAINGMGQPGTNGFWISGQIIVSGTGGSTLYGGSPATMSGIYTGNVTNGANATGYGAGGGGAFSGTNSGSGSAAGNGGTGGTGIVIITEYIS